MTLPQRLIHDKNSLVKFQGTKNSLVEKIHNCQLALAYSRESRRKLTTSGLISFQEEEDLERELTCKDLECQIIALKIKTAEEKSKFNIDGFENTMLLKKQEAISDLKDHHLRLKHSFLKRLLHCELLEIHGRKMIKTNFSDQAAMRLEIKNLIHEYNTKKPEYELECENCIQLYEKIEKIECNRKKWEKMQTDNLMECQSLQNQIDNYRQNESSLRKLRGVVSTRFGALWNVESRSEGFLDPHSTRRTDKSIDVPIISAFRSRSLPLVEEESNSAKPGKPIRSLEITFKSAFRSSSLPLVEEPENTNDSKSHRYNHNNSSRRRKWPVKKNLGGMAA